MLEFILLLTAVVTLPLALWLAYRLGHQVCEHEWEEAIEWSDDPSAVRLALRQGRYRIEKNDEYVLDD